MEAAGKSLPIKGRTAFGAGVAAGLIQQVAGHLVAGADTKGVQEGLDGVPHTRHDAGVQHCGVVGQVFFDGFSLRQLRVQGHGSIHGPLDARLTRVELLHQSVELRPGHDAPQAEVAQCLVCEDEA